MSEVLDFLGGLYNEIDDAVVLASLDAEPLFVNQAGRRLLALAAELDPSETRLEDYYPPDTWNMLREVGLPALKSSGRWAAEGHVKSGSDRVVPVRMTAFLVRHPRAERALYLALVHRDLTDSKRAEEGEALKNAILDSSLDPIITVDHEGAISEFNKAAEKTFKRSRSDAMGKRPDEMLFAASHEGGEQDRVERHVAVGEGSMLGRRTEITAVRSDGEPFPAEMAMTISRLHGLPVFMFFLRDIGERKRAEQALRDSQALYHSLVESLPMTVFRKDLEGRFTFGNRLFCEAMGHSLAELVGKNDLDFFPRELAEKYRRDDQQVMSTGEVLEAVEEYLRPDGTRIYVQTLKGPVRDSEGRLVGTQGMFWDVTARRQAEEALRESQQRLQSILDNATSVIYVKSLDGRYLLVNRSFETLFHVRRGEVLGKTDYDVFAPKLADAFRANDQKVLQAGRPLEFEEVAPHDDGPHTYISIKFPLADPAGSAHALCGISTDITERKRSEEALGRAKDAAEAANRAKSAFLANMSHEIRTPMNGIIGMTELLLDTQLSAEQHEYLELVKESADSLLSVINDVLDFSKVEAGKLDLEQIGFALRESLGDTMKTLALRAHKKNLELACHIRPEVPEHLVGDPGRLRQVIVNLVGNAIKFTDSGEVVVHVELLSRGSDDVVLHFSIADTGIGVPADKLELIFEAFEQADGSTSRKYGGTGLGLAISSKLVELMGGQIWVESHLGRGSTFHFNAQLLQPAGDALPPPVVEPAAIHDLPVLVVDDNATNRLILEEILTNWHMKPTAVAGAAEALAAMRAAADAGRPYPLVLLDAQMPQVDGFSLAGEIARSPQLAGATIMMLTSGDRPGDVARCEQLGIAAYLMKPIKQSELFDSVMAVLGARIAIEPAEAAGQPAEPAGRPLSILLAEDSLVNQKLAVRLLEKWGHRVSVAHTGHEAIEAVSARAFDLVLMDVQMPGMDGLEATAAIRRLERDLGRRTPIVAMTAHAMKGDRQRCLDSGMDGYLSKPIRARELSAEIERVVGGAPAASLADNGEPPELSPLDWQSALDRLSGDSKLLDELAEVFLAEYPPLLAQIRQSIDRGDASGLKLAAHTLKGALVNFAAAPAASAAAALELMGCAGELSGAADVCRQLECHLERLTPILSARAAAGRA